MLPDPQAQTTTIYRRARKWRLASITGGALLAAAFFMPSVKGCSQPEVPAAETVKMFNENPLFWPLGFYLYTAAYFFGFVVMVRAVASLIEWPRVERVSRGTIGWLLLLGCVVVLTVCSIAWGGQLSSLQPFTPAGVFHELWDDKGFAFLFFVLPALGLAYIVASRRAKDRRWLGHIFFMSGWCLIWFGGWVIFSSASDVFYGLYCSLAGSIIIWLSAVGESAALAERSYLRTFAGFLVAKIPSLFCDPSCCQVCGYSLIGLPEARCPECGSAFDLKQVVVPFAVATSAVSK